MKKYYSLFIATIIATSSMVAQNLAYAPVMHSTHLVADTSYEAYQIDVMTPTPEAITFGWTLISNTFPAGWDYALCDYNSCYVGIPGSGTMAAITLAEAQAGTRGFFKVNVTTSYHFGAGTVVFYVYDLSDINRGDTISMYVNNAHPLAIGEIADTSPFTFFPNPTQKDLNVNNVTQSVLNINLFNSLGQNVLSTTLAPFQKSTIDVAHLTKGIYFVSSTNAQGDKRTERLIIQ